MSFPAEHDEPAYPMNIRLLGAIAIMLVGYITLRATVPTLGQVCYDQLSSIRSRVQLMSISIKSLGIDRLGIEDRLTLVEEIWDSIAADSAAAPLTDAQRAELDRRIADHEANPNDVVPWQEIKASIAERLKR